MLNIEVIKFEAQDVITASVAHTCTNFTVKITNPLNAAENTFTCNECGKVYAGKNNGGKLEPDYNT